ncbi:carbon storage regulator CsrA [Neptunomonas japonica]|uniref:carbon storage regulator CsrA n=1 Tax=Neptunomonas japonica TaxID=417574 RepID=UPI000685E658|nr:carbon storage regulator CsrA [Neptunomonas japonica]
MLIFTLENGGSLMVGDDVTVTILAIAGKEVRLGTEAPKDIPVHREELYQRIHGHTLDSDKFDDARECRATKTVLRLLSNKLHR